MMDVRTPRASRAPARLLVCFAAMGLPCVAALSCNGSPCGSSSEGTSHFEGSILQLVVNDAVTRAAICNAVVTCKPCELTTGAISPAKTSDASCVYALTDLPGTTETLSIAAPGYKSQTLTVVLPEGACSTGESATRTVALEPQ